MVLAAERNGCLREVLVIAAALSIQDPRERPPEHQQAADALHRRFVDDRSDFLAFLNLWNYLREQQKALSSSAFRRMCTSGVPALPAGPRVAGPASASCVRSHGALGLSVTGELSRPATTRSRCTSSLLAGLLSHVGLRDPEKREYLGARGARFAIYPGSALFRKPPRWVMAAELVETSRLWARDLRRGSSPSGSRRWPSTWSSAPTASRTGRPSAVAAWPYEKVTLYGVPLVAGRTVAYGRIDPELSRELFIRHALVEGEWQTHHPFFHDNRALLEDVEELEHRARRRDIVVDDETLFAFYDERIPADVVSARHFDAWWKKARREQPDLLTFDPSMLVRDDADRVSADDYPDSWRAGRPDPAADLPVRAGRRRRRRHRARPSGGAQPGRPTASTGRCPACARSWSPR